MTNTGLLTIVTTLCIEVQTSNTTNPGRIKRQQNEVNFFFFATEAQKLRKSDKIILNKLI
jgi:hypothetical protein